MAEKPLQQSDVDVIQLLVDSAVLQRGVTQQQGDEAMRKFSVDSTLDDALHNLRGLDNVIGKPLLQMLELYRVLVGLCESTDFASQLLINDPNVWNLAGVILKYSTKTPFRGFAWPESWESDLFRLEPTASLWRLANYQEFQPLWDSSALGLNSLFRDLFELGIDVVNTPFRAMQEVKPLRSANKALFDAFKSIIRLTAVVSRASDLATLIRAGFDSAQSIAILPQDGAVNMLKYRGIDAKYVAQIYLKATTIAAYNEHAWVDLLRSKTEGLIPAIRKDEENAPKAPGDNQKIGPNFAQMFNDLNDVECQDCQSILSPAAYLVDLLHTLQLTRTQYTNTAPRMLDQLSIRRPDIIRIELTCENTNTPIPSIDLANQVLEAYLTRTYSKELKGDSSDDLGLTSYGLGPRGLRIYQDLIQPKCFPLEVFPYNYGSDMIMMVLRAHGVDASMLFNVFSSEYRTLDLYMSPSAGTSFSIGQCLQARVICNHARTCATIGIQAEDFLCLTHQRFARIEFLYAVGNNDKSIKEDDYSRYTGYSSCAKYWGYFSDADMLGKGQTEGLNFVVQVLDRGKIKLDDLVAMLKTDFMGGRLTITSSDGCDVMQQNPSLLRLCASAITNDDGSLTIPLCDDLQIFIRLLHRTGFSVSTLAACLSAVVKSRPEGTSSLLPAQLDELAALLRLAKSLDADVQDLAVMWADICPFDIEPYIFARLKVVAASSGGSVVDAKRGKLKFPASALPLIAATLQTTVQDAASIMNVASISSSDDLDMKHISMIYRISYLCGLLELEVLELEVLIKCTAAGSSIFDILGTPSMTLEFYSNWEVMRRDGWSVSDLSAVQSWKPLVTSMNEISQATFALYSNLLSSTKFNLKALKSLSGSLDDRIISGSVKEAGLLDSIERARSASLIGQSTKLYIMPPAKSQLKVIFDSNVELDQISCTLDGDAIAPTTDGNGSVIVLTPILQQALVYALHCSSKAASVLWITANGPSLPAGPTSAVPDDVFEASNSLIQLLNRFQQLTARYGLESNDLDAAVAITIAEGLYQLSPLSFNAILAISSYAKLKDTIAPSFRKPLVEFITRQTSADPGLAQLIAQATGWKQDLVQQVIAAKYPHVPDTEVLKILKAPTELLSIKRSIDVWSTSAIPGVTIEKLFALAEPTDDVGRTFDHARTLQDALYLGIASDGNDSTLDTMKAATNGLRESRRNVLIAYLLNHTDIGKKDYINTADDLFTYFLIDVNTGPIPETSRIQQAIASVQLFVQRSLLGLEAPEGVPKIMANEIKSQWNVIGRYSVWEANRKVFLYPENWVDPTLRDTKTPEFQALEASIMKEELTHDSVNSAIRQYVYSTYAVGNLEIQTYLWDKKPGGTGHFHFFGRTRTEPYYYYHRVVEVKVVGSDRLCYWKPWVKINIGNPVQTVNPNGAKPNNPGAHLVPALYRGRIYLFYPEIALKTDQQEMTTSNLEASLSSLKVRDVKSLQGSVRRWEIKLAWVEHRNGKWSPRSISTDAINIFPIADPLNGTGVYFPDPSLFRFRIRERKLESPVGVGSPSSTGVQGILIIDVESWDTFGALALVGLKRPRSHGHFELRDDHIISRPDTIPDYAGYTERTTIPTEYGKLLWSVKAGGKDYADRLPPWVMKELKPSVAIDLMPQLIDLDSADEFKSAQSRDLSWPLMMNFTTYTRPLGLVVDVRSESSAPRAYFALPWKEDLQFEMAEDMIPQFSRSAEGVVVTRMYNAAVPKLVTSAMSPDISAIFNTLKSQDKDGFGQYSGNKFHESVHPESIYSWELAVHLISLLMERLSSTQQFDLAIEVANLLFDPTHQGETMNDWWRFLPFTVEGLSASQSIDSILGSAASTDNSPTSLDVAIADWQANPFNAHSVARTRPVVYMKRIVQKYVETLVAAGDMYFRQNSMETLSLAMQKYIEALHILGPAPRKMKPIATPKGASYLDLTRGIDRYYRPIVPLDNFSNAAIDLELEFPYASLRRGKALSPEIDGDTKKRGLLGILATTYFCIPQNPQIASLRALIDDRLAKIRASQDINGNFRRLPLFDPPIDPGLLVQAFSAGQGLSGISEVLDSQSAPLPYYRFTYLLRKALEMTAELRSASDLLLSVQEKRDAETLAILKNQQESSINSIILTLKQTQKQEAEQSLVVLQDLANSHAARLQYFTALIGDNKTLPDGDNPWTDIPQSIDVPTTDELKMSPEESLEFSKASEAADSTTLAIALDGAAGLLHAFPNLSTNVQPMGMGVTMKIDGENAAKALEALATVAKLHAQIASDESVRSSRKAQLKRQLQDRKMLANQAGRDYQNVLKQMEAHKTRIQSCDIDIQAQQLSLKNAKDTEDWYKQKYTGAALYAWMENSVHTLLYQNYTMAMDLAQKVERSFQFERGSPQGSPFIDPQGYWNSAYNGLMSAQSLTLALKKMEAAYMDGTNHDFEIKKDISLRQINAGALILLRATGKTEFNVDEVIFDLDFPGHYLRRIKSIAVSIPCITGPYTSLNATLTLTSCKYRVNSLAEPYSYDSDDRSDSFRSDNVPITTIALSERQADYGKFELSFGSDEYFPFENAGAISRWSLQLPPLELARFDYSTISDVILHMRYTSRQGGAALQSAAISAVKQYIADHSTGQDTGLFALIDLPNDCSNEWNMASTQATANPRISLGDVTRFLPYWTKTKSTHVKSILAAFYSSTTSPDVPQLASIDVTSDNGASPIASLNIIKDFPGYNDGLPEGWSTFTQNGLSKSLGPWSLTLSSADETNYIDLRNYGHAYLLFRYNVG